MCHSGQGNIVSFPTWKGGRICTHDCGKGQIRIKVKELTANKALAASAPITRTFSDVNLLPLVGPSVSEMSTPHHWTSSWIRQLLWEKCRKPLLHTQAEAKVLLTQKHPGPSKDSRWEGSRTRSVPSPRPLRGEGQERGHTRVRSQDLGTSGTQEWGFWLTCPSKLYS